MPKYESIEIVDAALSAKISEYLQQNNTAVACKANAERIKKEILSDSRIDSKLKKHFDIANKNGKKVFKLEYKEHKAVTNPEILEKIAALKAEIKRLETENSVDTFWYFAMTEKKS